MSFLYIAIIIFIAIILEIMLATEFSKIAKEKGHYSDKYFWYCLFGSIAGYLLVIALKDISASANGAESSEDCDKIEEIESNSSKNNKQYNVCTNEETELFSVENISAGRMKDGRNLCGIVLSDPKGKVTVTNYRITFNCLQKQKYTFSQQFNDLTDIIHNELHDQINIKMSDGMEIYIKFNSRSDSAKYFELLNSNLLS